MKSRTIDMVGERCGKLLVLHRDGTKKDGNAMWRCQCDCGNERRVSGSTLRKGYAKSCGCSANSIRARKPGPVDLPQEQVSEAKRRYDLGFSMYEIAARFGIPEARVLKAFRRVGIDSRDRGGVGINSPLITDEVLQQARQMLGTPTPTVGRVSEVAAELDVPRRALRRALGLSQAFEARDSSLGDPIGTLPPDHPMYELDRQMLAARDRKYRANPWPTQSSLA